ncbi:MAG: M48 family metalloprotease [Selenomonadaceae bacterium]|nr:M48 family metalloprotease [Selenomonadaceae bacterium]
MIKIFTKILAAIILTVTLLTPLKVQAVDAWAIAAQGLGVYAAYRSTLSSILAMGNDVTAQMTVKRQDEKANGVDQNPHDVEVVDNIMNRLVNSGEYELRVNSLPFIWNVNDSDKFNAACYPMNYITVNKGLLRTLNGDENAIAAVLAHEMIHGIEQHSAKNYAQAIAQSLAATMIAANIDSRNVDWSKLSSMVNYSIAKSINLPAENEADVGGFYIMTSAGFNPGGGAAAMARMDYYMRYETNDFLEYDPHDKPNEQTMSDHPDTEVREENLSKLLTAYSMNHVTVEKVDRKYKVFIDGKEIYTAAIAGETYKSAEKAYYFAGGLAKAFHDYTKADDWNFREGKAGDVEFLTDDKVFNELREISFSQNLGAKIRDAVITAYQNEPADVRQKYLDEENKRKEYWEKIKAETLSANKNLAKKLRINADAYNDYGKGELALIEIERALNAEKQDDVAECLAIRGRAKAIVGDYDGALEDVNSAVEKDPSNLFNFLNRADVRHMRGETDEALADIEKALAIDPKKVVSYQLQGNIYDELGEKDKAEESFRRCYELSKKNPRSIPAEYLERIDPAAAEKIRKANEKSDS